ncbi:MAG: hypothetical protein Pyrs2KO_30230 [Pyruvatibacter sp.]
MPSDIDLSKVVEVGIGSDFLQAIMARYGSRWFQNAVGTAGAATLRRIQQDIRSAGVAKAHSSDIVVAGYHVARDLFRKDEMFRVLNYPTTHHRYTLELLKGEQIEDPEFAVMSRWNFDSPSVQDLLDEELDNADLVLSGSTFAANSLVSCGVPREKVRVIPYGFDQQLFVPQKSEHVSDFVVIYAGSISQRKGIAYLLRAFRKIRGPGTRLRLVGNAVADATPLGPYLPFVEWSPHMHRAMLAQELQMASVFVFPSLAEGLGLTVIEAMASGLPVITTACGADDIVEDGISGFVVPSRSADAISEKLIWLKENPDQRVAMGRAAQKRALAFSWSAYRRRAADSILESFSHSSVGN